MRGDVGDRRRAAQGLGQRVVGRGDGQPQLLQAAGHPDRPGAVAEVPLELADDGRDGEAGEVDAPVGVEPVDRLDQADHRDLVQVVGGLAAAAVAVGQVLGQRQPRLDRPVPQGGPLRVVGGQCGERRDQLAGRDSSPVCGARCTSVAVEAMFIVVMLPFLSSENGWPPTPVVPATLDQRPPPNQPKGRWRLLNITGQRADAGASARHQRAVVGSGERQHGEAPVRARHLQRLPVPAEHHAVHVGPLSQGADDLPEGEHLVVAAGSTRARRTRRGMRAGQRRPSERYGPGSAWPAAAAFHPVGSGEQMLKLASISAPVDAPDHEQAVVADEAEGLVHLAGRSTVGGTDGVGNAPGGGCTAGARRRPGPRSRPAARHASQPGASRAGSSQALRAARRGSVRRRPGRSSTGGRPPCAAACCATSGSPSPVPSSAPRASGGAAPDEPVEDRLRSSGLHARAVVVDLDDAAPPSRPPSRTADRRRRRSVTALSSRFASTCSIRRRSTVQARGVRRRRSTRLAGQAAALAGRPGPAPPRRPASRWAGWSLRASSSRSSTRRWKRSISSATRPGGGRRAVVQVVPAAVQDAGRRGQGLQRRAQLVADVGGEAAVPFDAPGELVDHLVERRGEAGQVGVGGRVEPGGEVAGGDLLGGVGDRAQRPQDVPGGVPARGRRRPRRPATRRGQRQPRTCSVCSSSRSESTS